MRRERMGLEESQKEMEMEMERDKREKKRKDEKDSLKEVVLNLLNI